MIDLKWRLAFDDFSMKNWSNFWHNNGCAACEAEVRKIMLGKLQRALSYAGMFKKDYGSRKQLESAGLLVGGHVLVESFCSARKVVKHGLPTNRVEQKLISNKTPLWAKRFILFFRHKWKTSFKWSVKNLATLPSLKYFSKTIGETRAQLCVIYRWKDVFLALRGRFTCNICATSPSQITKFRHKLASRQNSDKRW